MGHAGAALRRRGSPVTARRHSLGGGRRGGTREWRGRTGWRGGATAILNSRSTFPTELPRIPVRSQRATRFKASERTRRTSENLSSAFFFLLLVADVLYARDNWQESDEGSRREIGRDSGARRARARCVRGREERRREERERERRIEGGGRHTSTVRTSLLRVTCGQCERLRRAASMRLRRTALQANEQHADSPSSRLSSSTSPSPSSPSPPSPP